MTCYQNCNRACQMEFPKYQYTCLITQDTLNSIGVREYAFHNVGKFHQTHHSLNDQLALFYLAYIYHFLCHLKFSIYPS